MFQDSAYTNHRDKDMFYDVLKPSEKVLWTGRPSRLTYVIGSLPALIIGLIWGAIDAAILIGAIVSNSLHPAIVLFLLLHAFPLYMGIWGVIRGSIEYKNTAYAFSDERLILRTGVIGADYEMVDYDRILDMKVNTNPIEHMQGRGTIILSVGSVAVTKTIKLSGVEYPYDVLKDLQAIISEYVDNEPIQRDAGSDYSGEFDY